MLCKGRVALSVILEACLLACRFIEHIVGMPAFVIGLRVLLRSSSP